MSFRRERHQARPAGGLSRFLLREWLLIVSASGFALTSIHAGGLPAYSSRELQVLLVLLALLLAIKGLEESGLILRLSRGLEGGKAVPFKLVTATFFLSMLVTNDVALIVIVPVTLALGIEGKAVVVILEALAANAGSALTPFGNPQNLFLYWYYGLSPSEFLVSIAPFSLVFFVLLAVLSLFLRAGGTGEPPIRAGKTRPSSLVYGALLALVLLTVLRVLPVSAAFLVAAYVLLFDRRCLRIDYSLLLSFFFFFGLAENMKILLAPELRHAGHVFVFSALASQVMSNVPATLLFAKFTTHWKALLWGSNVGGFGSLFGSLANLIAYRLYVSHEDTNDTGFFTFAFLALGYAAFFLGVGLCFLLGMNR